MIIKFKPILFDKLWGGQKLKNTYASNLDNIGEVWGISAHPNGSSIVESGEHQGKTLKELFGDNKELFGHYEGSQFPILVKVIDAAENLSIQVHPNDEYAKEYNSLGKEECWYILDTDPGTNIIVGHNAETTEELNQAIDEDRIEEYCNTFPIKTEDFFYIKAGTIHAICKGTTLLEVQQSSDITYRVYDYKRKQVDGTFRDIHKEQGKEVITVPDNKVMRFPLNRYFNYELLDTKTLSTYTASIHGDYIYIIEGQDTFNKMPVKKGDFLMVPSKEDYKVYGNIQFQKTTF